MSRCLPYPPPGYEKKVGDVGLIESIKLQKEREKAKKERKKEKKREKKEKHKSREGGKIEEKKHSGDERHKTLSISIYQKVEGNYKEKRDQENEQLERSSISEEHGQPASIHCLHDSSDSSIHGSLKRKKPDTPSDACRNQLGSGLRIRLPLSKHKDPELPRKEPEPSTSGRAEIPVKEPPPKAACQFSKAATIPAKQPPKTAHEDSSAVEIPAKQPPKAATAHHYSSAEELMQSWKPIPLQTEHLCIDDEDWLFERRQQCSEPNSKRQKASSCSMHVTSAGLGGPRACYLPAADVYALPYVLPF